MQPAGPGSQDVEGGQALPEEQRVSFWSDVHVPKNIKERLSAALTDVYIDLDNLSKFIELNHDGFRQAYHLMSLCMSKHEQHGGLILHNQQHPDSN